MMPDERGDETIRLGAGKHVLKRVITAAGAAGVGLLVGGQCGIFEKSVFEIVYSDLHGLIISDRAQMARNLEAPLMCRVDRGAPGVKVRSVLGLPGRNLSIKHI